MRIKVNDEWFSVRQIEYYSNGTTALSKTVLPKEVQDVEFVSRCGFSYNELMSDFEKLQKKFNERNNESNVTEAAQNDALSKIKAVLDELRNRDQFLADSLTNLQKQFNELAKRITELEDGLTTHVIGDYEHLKDDYVNRVSEHQTMQPIEQHFAEASKVNWEQRRYEIAKACVTTIFASDQKADYGALANRAVNLADCVIANLKSREK